MLKKNMEKAICDGDLLQVSLLLHSYPNDKHSLGNLLSEACKIGFKDIDIFLDQGAYINYACRKSWRTTPLMYACSKGNTDTVKALLDRGASINLKNAWGQSALHDASSKNHLDIVKMLVEKGAVINGRDKTGYTPLHNACTTGGFDVAKFLLSSGANIGLVTNYNDTAVGLAKRRMFTDIVELFD